MTTPILGLDELAPAQSQPEVIVNAALRGLEAVTQLTVDAITDTPPGSPVDGDRVIVDVGGSGAFSGHDSEVAYYSGGWLFLTPRPGWRAYVLGDGWYQFNEDSPGAWDADSSSGGSIDAGDITSGTLDPARLPPMPYDVGAMFTGVPDASAVVMRYKFPRSVSFASGLSPSQGVAGTAATAQTDFDIQKNGVSIGTMRFAAAATAATFIMASSETFVAGDRLTVIAPASPDATLADVAFVLAGTR